MNVVLDNWVILLLSTGSTVSGAVYFYWKAADRRLTDIPSRQEWFKRNYEGDIVSREKGIAKITSISCYPPDKVHKKALRYALIADCGYTEITLVYENLEIDDPVWDILDELLDANKRRIVNCEYSPRMGHSFVTIQIDGFDSERFENAASVTVNYINEQIQFKNSNKKAG